MVCVFVFVCLWGSTSAGLAFCATLSMTKLIIILILILIACNGFCLLRHTKTRPARDIISYDVFACTLLHRELRDYSLGQIAFAVFRALFAITQLLCHVSALLTSACKQA